MMTAPNSGDHVATPPRDHRYEVSAYAQTQQRGYNPRQLEAAVLERAAVRLGLLCEDRSPDSGEMVAALDGLRKVWGLLTDHVRWRRDELPETLHQTWLKLSLHVFQTIGELCETWEPDKARSLVQINREIAAGLRGDAGHRPFPHDKN